MFWVNYLYPLLIWIHTSKNWRYRFEIMVTRIDMGIFYLICGTSFSPVAVSGLVPNFILIFSYMIAFSRFWLNYHCVTYREKKRCAKMNVDCVKKEQGASWLVAIIEPLFETTSIPSLSDHRMSKIHTDMAITNLCTSLIPCRQIWMVVFSIHHSQVQWN